MDGVIVYGSLINRMELTQQGLHLDYTSPVILQGFQRIFCQEPSRRTSGRGEARAVLNAISSREHWLNGLLIVGLGDGLLVDLDKREGGYVRTEVDTSNLRKYDCADTTPVPQNVYIYTGKINKQSHSILPDTSYMQICLEGAKQWGKEFYGDFLNSTFVKKSIPLRAYLGMAV